MNLTAPKRKRKNYKYGYFLNAAMAWTLGILAIFLLSQLHNSANNLQKIRADFTQYKLNTDLIIADQKARAKVYEDIVLKQQAEAAAKAEEIRKKEAEKRRRAMLIQSEVGCLAENIYREAAYEPVEGQLAVATVTMNRVANQLYPKTVCNVVYQRGINKNNGKIVCQFSWTCKPRHPIITKVYQEILTMAKAVYFQHERNPDVQDALLYHATYIKAPNWATDDARIVQIGLHVFYR